MKAAEAPHLWSSKGQQLSLTVSQKPLHMQMSRLLSGPSAGVRSGNLGAAARSSGGSGIMF